MTIYVCLDDRNGMQFNRRRQSRDAVVLEDIQRSACEGLFIDPFSEKLLAEAGIPYTLAPEDLSLLSADCHFFAENRSASEILSLAQQVVIYCWNRHYPADVHWDADLFQQGFTLTQTDEFPGKSHEKITKEVYVR